MEFEKPPIDISNKCSYNRDKNICLDEKKGGIHMMITRNNLNRVTFENEDARLLIQDVVSHTSACLYYYDTEIEITVSMALKIRERAYKADRQDSIYSASLTDMRHMPFREVPRLRKVCGLAAF